MKIYFNGKFVDKKEAKISIFDHGVLYGDGVFEGIRAYSCLVFKLKEHIERIYRSAHAILLDIPLSKAEMAELVIKTLKVNKLKDAYIRLVVTRGEGDLGLDPRKCKSPTVFIITDTIAFYSDDFYKKGLEIVTVPTRRNIPEALSPQIKSLNYLNNILAKIEAVNRKSEEAIMLNHDGFVAECTGDNIFMIKSGRLYTPPAYMGILEGITRGCVMDLARKMAMPVAEPAITRYELYNADEVFLTGTAAEIIPVIKIDSRPIKNGKPGEITLALIKEFRKLTKTDGARYAL